MKEVKEISIANHRHIYRWKIVSGLDPKNIERVITINGLLRRGNFRKKERKSKKAHSNGFGVGGRTLEVILSQYRGQTFEAFFSFIICLKIMS